MKTSKTKTTTVTIEAPLPPCWVRRSPTRDETREKVSASLLSAGPKATLRDALVRIVDEARETVLLASFLFSDPELCQALLAAHARGVRIYVLTASEARLRNTDDESFTQDRVREHKQLLNRLAGKVVLRSAGCFHAKFVVADHQSKARGWLSTANLNPALLDARELGVALDERAAQQVAGWFCWAFWTCAEHELTAEKGRLRSVAAPPAEPGEPELGPILVTTPKHQPLRERLLDWIRNSEDELWVSSYSLDTDHEVVRALIERAEAGVSVTVLTRPRPAVRAAAVALRFAGATVLAHDKLHAKALVCDRGAVVMTANLDGHSLDHSFEVGLELDARTTAALAKTLQRWSKEFPWRFETTAKRADSIGEIWLAELGRKDGKREVVEEETVNLGDVTARDALDLDDAPDPKLVPPKEKQALPAKLRYEWTIHAPRLPKRAKPLKYKELREVPGQGGTVRTQEVEVEYDPPAYQLGDKRYVVVEPGVATGAARELASELDAKVVVR